MSGDHNMKDSFECPRCGHCCEEKERDPKGLDQHAPGAKLDAEKQRPSLVFEDMFRALNAVISVGEYGAKKYSYGGWLRVEQGEQRYTNAMYRHILAENEDGYDRDTQLLHAAHVAWNAMARLELMLRSGEWSLRYGDDND
jgi:hypothetical protein